MNEGSFYSLSKRDKRVLLSSQMKYGGDLVDHLEGFSGNIYVFKLPCFPNYVCAKIPKVSQNVDSEEAARRFMREIKIQRCLYYHQYVHWPFDFDFILDAPVAWFRFWDCDLSKLIGDFDFTISGRLAMLAYIADGMQHCHRKGLIAHQDFKPENVFVRNYGAEISNLPDAKVFLIPKIADFGSANLASEVGEFRGTRAYMAPEQWDKQPLGEHTTVWSIGLMAYELLSYGLHPIGEPTKPWRNKDCQVFKRWQNDKMWKDWKKSGMVVRKELESRDADRFIRICMSMDPSSRPSLEEVRTTLLNLLKSESMEAYEQTAFQIEHAKLQSTKDYDWPYLDARYECVSKQVAYHFDKK